MGAGGMGSWGKRWRWLWQPRASARAGAGVASSAVVIEPMVQSGLLLLGPRTGADGARTGDHAIVDT